MIMMPSAVSRRVAKRLSDPKGANLIEAAIIMPLIFLMSFSIAEFSALLYVHMALQNGVSQATRFGVIGSVLPGQTREASIRSMVQQETPTLDISDGDISFTHIPPGGSGWIGGSGPPDSIERVSVTYTWPIMTPLLRPFFSGDEVTFNVESTMKNEEEVT